MRPVFLLSLMAALGCASRPQPLSPYVPPETQYSTVSTVAAAAGLMSMAAGASLTQGPGASQAAQTAGKAALAAGAGAVALSLFDVFEVRKEREKFFNLTRAFYHDFFGAGQLSEEVEQDAPPPVPEVPYAFPKIEDEDTP